MKKSTLLFTTTLIAAAAGTALADIPLVDNSILINFNSSSGATEETGEDPQKTWNNFTDGSQATGQTLVSADNSSTGATVTWSAHGVWKVNKDETGTILNGYLDDNNSGTNQKITITVSNISYVLYDVVFLCAADSGAGFTSKTVNGFIYTYDAESERTISTDDNKASWGSTGNKDAQITEGTNAFVARNIVGSTLNISSVANNVGSDATNIARGNIAGIMIVDRSGKAVAADVSGTTNSWTSGNFVGESYTGTKYAVAKISEDAEISVGENLSASGIVVRGSSEKTLTLSGNGKISLEKNATIVANDQTKLVARNDIAFTDGGEILGNVSFFGNLDICGDVYGDVSMTNDTNAGSTFNFTGASGTISGKLYGKSSTFNIGDGTNASILSVNRLEIGDINDNSKTSVLNVNNNATLKITGSNNDNDYKNASLVLGEWGLSTTATISGTLLSKDAQILLGDKGGSVTVGGTLAAKGIGDKNGGSFALTLNDGGKLILGETGIGATLQKTYTITLNSGTVGMYKDNTTIGKDVTISSGKTATFDTNKYVFAADGNSISEGDSGGTMTISGVISGDGSLAKSGAGTLVLSGDNTYSGGTTISKGTLQVDNANALGTGTVTIGTDGVLSLGVNSAVQNLTCDGGVLKASSGSAATLTVNGSCLFSGFINDGVSLVASNITGGQITLCNGATLKLTGTNAAEIFVWNGTNLIANTATVGTVSVSDNAKIQLTKTVTDGTITLGTDSKIFISADFESADPTLGLSSLGGYSVFGVGDPVPEDKALYLIATNSISGFDKNNISNYFELDSSYDLYKAVYSVNNDYVYLTLSIPEPSAFGLLAGLGALALAGTRRRRKVK